MFKLHRFRWPHCSGAQTIVGTAVLVVIAAVLLTIFPTRRPSSAAKPPVSEAMPSSSPAAAAAASPLATKSIPPPETSPAASATDEPIPEQPSPTTPVATSAVPDQVPAPAPTEPQALEGLITGRVMHTTEVVNVRETPSASDPTNILDVLGAQQQVTAGDAVNGWVPVQAGNIYGWVSSSYLVDGAPTQAPAAAASADGSSGNWMEALIPQVDPGEVATWVFRRNGGWGASDGYTIYIDPNVPSEKHFSVMVHEYSHVLQVQVFGSLRNSVGQLSALIGGSPLDITANESTADCMALMLGATWVNYGCQDSLRDAATAILAGHRP